MYRQMWFSAHEAMRSGMCSMGWVDRGIFEERAQALTVPLTRHYLLTSKDTGLSVLAFYSEAAGSVVTLGGRPLVGVA